MAKNQIILKKLKHRNFELYKYFEKALDIIRILNDKSYEAYIVGGAVRDILLNIDFNDIDITTNATPRAIRNLFENYKIDSEFEHLGSVTLYIDNYKFELTTFRNEEYVKQKIKNVHYSKRLADDVVRRDFTINALAFPLNLELIDLINGKKDLDHNCIKIIGKAKQRFKEDPSRILRGFHLVAKLNFNINLRTSIGMIQSRKYLNDLSNYRITLLMKKILNEKYANCALKKMHQLNIFKTMPEYDKWLTIIIKNKKLSYLDKFVVLYRIKGEIPLNNSLTHLENMEIRKVYELVEFVSNNDVTGVDIIQLGIDNLLKADKIAKMLDKEYLPQSKAMNKIYRNLPVYSVRDLKITGLEIKNIIGENSQLKIGDIINELLLLIVDGVIENRFTELEKAVKLISEGKELTEKYDSNINYDHEPIEENERILSLLNSTIENKSKVGIVEDAQIEEHQMLEEDYNSVVDVEPSNTDDSLEIPTEENINEYANLSYQSTNDLPEDEENITQYYEDYRTLYQIHKKNVFKDFSITEFDEKKLEQYENQVKAEVKQILLDTNPKYQDLNNRGKI